MGLKTHGMKGTKVYRAWQGMKTRCRKEKFGNRCLRYLERNMTLPTTWRESFESFLSDMGLPPSEKHSLDRINNSQGYSKENCRWATIVMQNNNRGDFNYWITWKGERKTCSEWAKSLNMKPVTLKTRLRRGWSIKRALGTGV